jgi:hypothetical protein
MLEDGHPRFESMKVGSVEPAGRQWWTVVGMKKQIVGAPTLTLFGF